MRVPFLDLRAHHAPHQEDYLAAIQAVIEKNAFASGPFVARFEEDFAAFCRTQYTIGVGSGTDALWLTLLALGVGPGDEVLTSPLTFMATAEAISFCGARPVFVDVDETTYTLNPKEIEAAITPRTKVIIPVHLYGQMADMGPILTVAERYGLAVVEDACQAHGADYQGKPAGSLGRAGCFSFYPGKNLGAFGEAGATVTSDPELKWRITMLRDHGQAQKYYHALIGWNARMDGIQGAVLRLKLQHLAAANERRRELARLYDHLLADVEEVAVPAVADYGTPVYHLYVIRVRRREELLPLLAQRGIGCGIHYPICLHQQEAYRFLGYETGALPVAERCAREVLSLPMYPELTTEQVHQVVQELKTCLAEIGNTYVRVP